MKPSTVEGEPPILTTKPECRVVLDALDDPQIFKPEYVSPYGVEHGIDTQFRVQTRYTPPGSSREIWFHEPEYRVRRQDIQFILEAAQRVEEESSPTRRAFDRLTRRTSAARKIVQALSTYAESTEISY